MTRAVVVGSSVHELETALRAALVAVRWESEAALVAGYGPANAGEVVVVDLRGARSVPAWLPAFRRSHPSAPVLAIVSSLDASFILEAMRAGANEVLPEPLTTAEIEAAFGRLTTARGADTGGRVLAFIGAKGGVGTTTAAVNVATMLSRKAPTLLVDLHLSHGDAAVLLGVEARFSVVDALENVQRLDKAFFKGLVAKPKAGPDILPSSGRTFVPQGVGQNIRALVEFAARVYPYTVLDVPRDAAALDALDAAARIVVVANQELPTVRNAARIAETLRQRYGVDRLALVVCRYDTQAEIGQEDVERVTGIRNAMLLPSDYRVVLQALNAGRPLTLENHTRLASSYKDLAERLVGTGASKSSAPQPGLFGRLIGRRS